MNNSIVKDQFPIFRWVECEKWLFNPVLKKRFKNRPEERVRLKWVEFLLNHTSIKSSRIGFETAVHLRQEENAGRADLLLFNPKLEPIVLIECKADTVSLKKGSAEQASRYNREVGAEYIIISNGVKDHIYSKNGEVVNLKELPFDIQAGTQSFNDKDILYWSERGFCDFIPDRVNLFNHFWSQHHESDVRYLNFKESLLSFPMDHYYRIYKGKNSDRLAVGLLGFNGMGSYLVAILNKKGVNKAVAVLQLSRPKDQNNDQEKMTVYSRGVIAEKAVSETMKGLLANFRVSDHQSFPKELMKYF